ncbi:MAG: glycoside hydrolase family 43 protein [Blautia sp.]|nr:glycoside hydrolase family 43 protein [Blautia sp.]
MDRTLQFNQPWILQRADPYVYRHTNGKYYFTASLPEYDGIALRCSDTLAGLKDAEEVRIWNKHESGIMSCHIWAPELHYMDGAWYIYYAGGDKDDIWEIRPYVLECKDADPMTGTWVEKGLVERSADDAFSFTDFSLDATVFENKGKRYFVWAEKVSVGQKISNLYIAEMETPLKLKTAQVLLSTPCYDWERIGFWVNEGPFALKKNGRIFLTYSASETGVDYCVGMLTADENADLLDPSSWKKERYPVLCTDRELEIYGPGHNCFTVDEEGRDIMVYHARTEEKIEGNPLYNPNRHAMLMEVKWDESGRPVFAYR